MGDENTEICMICGKPVLDYNPKYCCNGTDCGCKGLPVEPCVCSRECGEALFGNIGYSYEKRRKLAGIKKFE